MIERAALMNVLAWALQAAIVVPVAGVLPRLARVADPRVRHAYWRALLVLCLLLPAVQPWQAPPPSPVGAAVPPAATAPPAAAVGTRPVTPTPVTVTQRASAMNWPLLLTLTALAVALLRLAWLAEGVRRLGRLRRVAERAGAIPEAADLDGLDAAATAIYYAPGIRQPVTFGIRRPAICLPESLRARSADMRRVVIAHELWHVRRRDWAWLVAEEVLRSIVWFHPAIVWVISRVQQTREEVVDRLTVRETNARRTYLEALLAFADEPAPLAVASFARRRHLVHRIGLLSREAVMSSKRVVAFAVVVLAVVALTSVYAASRFPLTAAPAIDAGQAAVPQAPPRDPKPAPASQPADEETALRGAIAAQPGVPGNYIELSRLQEERGAYPDAEATLADARSAVPNNTVLLRAIAGFYNRKGDFAKTMEALEAVADVDPTDPARHQLVATYYWEKAYRDQRLAAGKKQEYVDKGIAATDRALAADPNAVDALAYKNLLLRLRAAAETDAATRARLIAEADAIRTRAMEIKKTTTPPPPPPPPPAPPRDGHLDGVPAEAPVRVGGDIKAPKKIKDVLPAYPQLAFDARVQGVVIVEATVGPTGQVQDVRVLRSIPLLDQAALDAVRQWEFEPTLLNGRPVPVILTLTVTFSMQ